MADEAFEQFKADFEKMPQHIKAPVNCYRLVHDLDVVEEVEEEEEMKEMMTSERSVRRKETSPRKLPLISTCEDSLWEEKCGKTSKSWVREIGSNMFLEIEFNEKQSKPTQVQLRGGASSDSGASSTIDSPTNSFATESSHREEATHRGLYKFIPRHLDEVEIEVGDPVFVEREDEDYWCLGLNLRTGAKGIFPSSVITDVNYSDLLSIDYQNTVVQIKKERFLLTFLGSVEVFRRKGNQVISQAIEKIESHSSSPQPSGLREIPLKCVLEVSDLGVRLLDLKQEHDYFFKLKDITFCGFHDRDYFAFITKHPNGRPQFACHVFRGEKKNCREVGESIGRAFTRFYNHFMELSMPSLENFYLE